MPDFPPLQNDRLLRAARREPVDRVPVWAMRQAGRYLPEFQAVRAEHDFFTVCRTPELACEVTLQPLRRFDLDASIIFSDILVIPQALGQEVQMIKGRGPVLPDPLRRPEDLDRLVDPAGAPELQATYDALRVTRQAIGGKVPLIGFSGAPWTLMAYMTEGGGSKSWVEPKRWLYATPEAGRALLDLLADAVTDYLLGQAEAGAQALQVFDSHAGELPPHVYEAFVLPGLLSIGERVKAAYPDLPLIVFARGGHAAISALARSAYDVVGLDHGIAPAEALKRAGGHAALQGNLDPGALYGSPATIREETATMLDGFRDAEGNTTGLIANLGHGMQPGHNPEHLMAFVDAVHDLSGS